MTCYHPTFLYKISLVCLTSLCLLACDRAKESQVVEDAPQTEQQPSMNKVIYSLSQAQFTQMAMRLGKIEYRAFPKEVQATGRVEIPQNNRASVSSLMSGQIVAIDLLPGQFVKKGQAIVRLQNIELIKLQEQYLELSKSMRYLQSEYERNRILADEKINSKRSFYESESHYLQAQAKMQGLAEQLKLLGINPETILNGQFITSFTINAPISGVVQEVHVHKGTTITPQDDLVDLYSTSKLHLDLNVFERDVAGLKPGLPIAYQIPELDKAYYKADIHFINKQIDEDNRTLQVHGDIITKPKNTVAGMYVTAKIRLNEVTQEALPETALVAEGDKSFIYVLQSDQNGTYVFDRKAVEVGPALDGYYPLLNAADLDENALILVNGAYYLDGENQ